MKFEKNLKSKKEGSNNIALILLMMFLLAGCKVDSEHATLDDYVDKVAPTVVSIYPEDGADDVALDTPVIITFSEAMDTTTITTNTTDTVCSGSIQLSADDFTNCVQMSGEPAASDNNKVFTLTPATSLLNDGSTYKIKIATEAKDIGDQSVAAVSSQTTGFTILPPLDSAISTSMKSISAGSFTMGDSAGVGNSYETPTHTVTLSAFYISDHEVTAAEYKACVDAGGCTYSGGTSSYYTYNASGKDDHPINYVSWTDAQSFITWLNSNSSRTYALCTEAQWEYAARAGTATKWSCGDNESCLGDVAWYDSNNSPSWTKEVKTKTANAWGLYDMQGNVWEWTADWFGSYSSSSVTDPTGASSGSGRVVRGGAFYSPATYLRSASRDFYSPSYRSGGMGFRLCSVN